jgi:hypothetical protein
MTSRTSNPPGDTPPTDFASLLANISYATPAPDAYVLTGGMAEAGVKKYENECAEAERREIRRKLDEKWEKFKEGLEKELVVKGVDDATRQEIAGTIEDIQEKAGTAKASEVKRFAEQLGDQVAPALGAARAKQIEEDVLKRAVAQREAVIEAKVAIGKYSVEDGQRRMNRHARGLEVDEVPEINAPGEQEAREPTTNHLNPVHVDSNEIVNTPSLAQLPLASTHRRIKI